MANNSFGTVAKRWILIMTLVCVPSAAVFAQESPFTAAMRTSLIEPVPASPLVHRTQPIEQQHRFWNRNNSILFVAVGAMSTADFFVTRNNLAHGGRELNPITGVLAGSTTGLAFNFAGETAGSIAVSYLFHKTGHHKLERLTSFVNIGASTGAVGFGLARR